MELRGYLEERVSEEVAPESQLPMTLGDSRKELAQVYTDILQELQDNRAGQLQMFVATESRGIEDEVLAAADSNIVERYFAFKKALSDKNFLCDSTEICADYYYEKLRQEGQLESLHSSMRRNYAAALQDDAQQVMNTMLKSGLTEMVLKDAKASVLYKNYPAYLKRAAELLGNQHYMYPILMARKNYFEAQIAAEQEKKRALYKKALSRQANMPHAMVELIMNADADQLDSASHYFQKSIDLVPSWVEPYIAFSNFYKNRLRQADKAEELLNMASQIDSTSLLVWYKKAQFYNSQRKYKAAEKWYLETTEAIEGDICFPCAYHDLGLIYRATRRYEEAEKQFKKAIQLDSTFTYAYNNLASVYFLKGNFTKAEKNLKKSIQCDSLYVDTYLNLAFVYTRMHRDVEAEQNFKKAIEINPAFVFSYNSLGSFYIDMHRYEEAEHYFMKATLLDSTFWMAYANLGLLYQTLQNWEAAEPIVIKAIQNAPPLASLHAMLGNTYTHLAGKLDEAKEKFDQALEMDPDSPDTYIYLPQWYIETNQPEEAWQYLEQGLEKRIENGQLDKDYLVTQSDFEIMKKDPKWTELMEKFFSEENKK